MIPLPVELIPGFKASWWLGKEVRNEPANAGILAPSPRMALVAYSRLPVAYLRGPCQDYPMNVPSGLRSA